MPFQKSYWILYSLFCSVPIFHGFYRYCLLFLFSKTTHTHDKSGHFSRKKLSFSPLFPEKKSWKGKKCRDYCQTMQSNQAMRLPPKKPRAPESKNLGKEFGKMEGKKARPGLKDEKSSNVRSFVRHLSE